MTRGQLHPDRRYLDKWQMHLALTHAAIQGLHLPATKLLAHIQASDFQQCASWYVKPLGTWGGQHIAKIEKGNMGWQMKQDGRYEQFPDEMTLLQRLYAAYAPTETIVQQTAPVATLTGKPFDVRVLCQRDAKDTWLIAGWLARVGREDSIVSNIGTGHGQVLPLPHLLKQLYKDKDKGRHVKQKLQRHSLAICRMLDTYHAFEEVGIDFGLSAQGQVWLFEVNTNDMLGGPSHELFKALPDNKLYTEITARADARQRQFLHDLLHDITHYESSAFHNRE
ncbi:YheC/YheD family protein [Alicyclobacillus fodiniaquatilis]|uniref:YheC/YheD family protein n=1 Tax=Alicyclobacillus fodiniaquatilis TaxID=1661150 RepID=A0ABW4JCY4_9BACL